MNSVISCSYFSVQAALQLVCPKERSATAQLLLCSLFGSASEFNFLTVLRQFAIKVFFKNKGTLVRCAHFISETSFGLCFVIFRFKI